jgi:signal transduction histidine kinase
MSARFPALAQLHAGLNHALEFRCSHECRVSPSRLEGIRSWRKAPAQAAIESTKLQHVDTAARVRSLEERQRLLSSALRNFAEATTDYEALLDVIAKTLAEVVKDGCVVRLLGADGWLLPVAMHLPFEQKVHEPEAIARLTAHISGARNVNEHAAGRQVLETGQALLVPKMDYEQLRQSATGNVVDAYETIGIHSLLLVALRVRGESFGFVALVRFLVDSPPFDEADRDFAQALADHAALAISNARLLRSVREELAERERAEAALRKSEEQLRQAQKMEAIGRLSGSVAHDFNNLLSVILSYSDLLLSDLKPIDPLRGDIESIRKAGEKAADLTRQLLAFSRQQVLAPRVVDLNSVLVDSEKMLRRLLGEDIEIVTHYARTLSRVKVDSSQIDQVLLNLVINARDAMPNGGKLTIETKDVELDESYTSEHFGVARGPHVMLAVSDTGVGMDPQTQARIFEPFFTTKDIGKGTGLGLSTVFGIVKQSGGHIWVYSEPGGGSTFKIYFPALEIEADESEPPEPVEPVTLHGTETILLVEDQDEVRRVAQAILRRYGYHVIEARNAGEALLTCERHPRTIHLLLTDVVMPQLSGRELAERVAALRPTMKVLYMSGYTENVIVHHGILDSGIAYLQKPIVPELLARRVREVLDSYKRSRG